MSYLYQHLLSWLCYSWLVCRQTAIESANKRSSSGIVTAADPSAITLPSLSSRSINIYSVPMQFFCSTAVSVPKCRSRWDSLPVDISLGCSHSVNREAVICTCKCVTTTYSAVPSFVRREQDAKTKIGIGAAENRHQLHKRLLNIARTG